MSNESFRSLWNLFDSMTIPFLRGPLTQTSLFVKQTTGLWFHPATWQTVAALLLVVGGYWLFTFARPLGKSAGR